MTLTTFPTILLKYAHDLHREYFEDVDRTWETFEKTLWGHISNFYKLAKERYDPHHENCFLYLLQSV